MQDLLGTKKRLWIIKGYNRFGDNIDRRHILAKDFTKEDVIQNKKAAIKTLNRLLEGYINDPTGKRLKKANLISYWLKDYAQMINFEEKFDPTRNIAYKRGDIVKLNFGFNIGSEYGGLHYGIVIDNKNAHNSPTVTVIPLTSIKASKSIHENSVELGNEIYKSLKLKYDTIAKSLKEEQEKINEFAEAIAILAQIASEAIDNFHNFEDYRDGQNELKNVEKCLAATDKIEEIWKEREKHNLEQQEYLQKIGMEISHMKEGSVALVNQITTVSKIRIFDPCSLKGVLSGISLSEENMDKINEKLKTLYIF